MALVMTIAFVVASATQSAASIGAGAPHARPAARTVSRASTAPGTLIASQQVTATGINATAYLVKYWSESSPQNKPVMVTGLVFVPEGKPPSGGWPVVSWAHGTDGMVGLCAPSQDAADVLETPNLLNALLAKGWEVVATDYQGEGDPALIPVQQGLLPYLVGVPAARNAIDIVRAAGELSAAHASSNYVVMGHSEGGQTGMFTLEIAHSYAPKLSLKGVVAIAPPSQVPTIFSYIQTSAIYWPFLYLLAYGYNYAYGNAKAPLGQLLTHQGQAEKSLIHTDCLNSIFLALDKFGFSKIFSTTTLPSAWLKLGNENDPGQFTAASSVPLLIVQGSNDQIVPPATSATLATHLCGLGQDLERWIYPGLDHNGIVTSGLATGDEIHWIVDRFAGASNPDPYTPVGAAGITTTTCPS